MAKHITLDEWKAAGLTYTQYENDRKRDKLNATRATRNHPVMIDVDSIKDEAKKAKIIAALGDPNAKNSSLPDVIETTLSRMTEKDREIMWSRWYLTLEFDKVRSLAKSEKRNVDESLRAFYFLFCNEGRWEKCRNILSNSKKVPPSIKTIYKWSEKIKKDYKPETLAPNEREKRPDTKFTDEQKLIITTYYSNPTQPAISTVHRQYLKICELKGWPKVKYEAVYEFLKDLYRTKGASIDKDRYGHKYAKDHHEPHIQRDWSKVKFMDCIVADGHLLNFHIKDENNRKYRPMLVGWIDDATNLILGFDIMRTENTLAVASSFRLAMINAAKMMGLQGVGIVPREVYTDNGRAFKNQYWDGLSDFGNFQEGVFAKFRPFGLEYVTRAIAYNARSKTIERKFRDFDEVEKMVPTYLGNCIDNRPAYHRRNEMLAKERYLEALAEFGWLDLQSAYNLVQAWVDEVNERASNGRRLQGYSPTQLAAQHILEVRDWNARVLPKYQLNELMMHTKTVKLKQLGVEINNRNYYNMDHFPLLPKTIGLEYIVKYSPLEPDSVLVYNTDGSFLCEAIRWIGDDVDAKSKQRGSDAMKHLSDAMEAQRKVSNIIDDEARKLAGMNPRGIRSKKLELAESNEAEAVSVEAGCSFRTKDGRLFKPGQLKLY